MLALTAAGAVQSLRQQSKGFQKASSQYRGVTRHQKGKWEARIGQASGKKYKCAPPDPLGSGVSYKVTAHFKSDVALYCRIFREPDKSPHLFLFTTFLSSPD